MEPRLDALLTKIVAMLDDEELFTFLVLLDDSLLTCDAACTIVERDRPILAQKLFN